MVRPRLICIFLLILRFSVNLGVCCSTAFLQGIADEVGTGATSPPSPSSPMPVHHRDSTSISSSSSSSASAADAEQLLQKLRARPADVSRLEKIEAAWKLHELLIHSATVAAQCPPAVRSLCPACSRSSWSGCSPRSRGPSGTSWRAEALALRRLPPPRSRPRRSRSSTTARTKMTTQPRTRRKWSVIISYVLPSSSSSIPHTPHTHTLR